MNYVRLAPFFTQDSCSVMHVFVTNAKPINIRKCKPLFFALMQAKHNFSKRETHLSPYFIFSIHWWLGKNIIHAFQTKISFVCFLQINKKQQSGFFTFYCTALLYQILALKEQICVHLHVWTPVTCQKLIVKCLCEVAVSFSN